MLGRSHALSGGAIYAALGEYTWHLAPGYLAAGTAVAIGAAVLNRDEMTCSSTPAAHAFQRPLLVKLQVSGAARCTTTKRPLSSQPDCTRREPVSEPTGQRSKRCTKCGKVKPLEDFSRNARRSDGRRSACRVCQSVDARRYNEDHREVLLQRGRDRRRQNLERELARERRYRDANREAARARSRRWARENAVSQLDYQRQYSTELKATVLAHYGTACACCGSTSRLTIDHINGDGREHREELFGSSKAAGRVFYRWLIRNHFPEGYQTLCGPCNISKGRGERCRIAHRSAVQRRGGG